MSEITKLSNIDKANLSKIAAKIDGWNNTLTNLGQSGIDKIMSAAPLEAFLKQADVDAHYQADDIGARIVDRPISDMFREGFEIKIIDGDEKLEEDIKGDEKLEEDIKVEMERLDLHTKMADAYRWANIYGSGMLLIGMKEETHKDFLSEQTFPIQDQPLHFLFFYLLF